MQAEQSILDRIQIRQLKWYGHLLRIDDNRWSKNRVAGLALNALFRSELLLLLLLFLLLLLLLLIGLGISVSDF